MAFRFPWFRAPAPVPVAAGVADAGTLAPIHASAFARGWSAAEFEALLADPAVIADVIRPGGSRRYAPQGFVVSRKALDEAEILTVAVAADRRRRGLGRELLARHLGRLMAAGVTRVLLEVDEANEPAQRLYAGFGFAPVGRRENYYRGADGARSSAIVLALEIGGRGRRPPSSL